MKRPFSKPMLWKMDTDAQLRRWPEGNTAVNLQGNHLRTSFMPRKNFSSDGDIKLAKPLATDILGKHNIDSMGFAEHTAGYYHSRVNKGFYDVLFVVCGELRAGAENLHESVKKGCALVLPPNVFCTTSVECKKTSLIWFHLFDNAFWRGVFGCGITVKRTKCHREIEAVMKMYEAEIFSQNHSLNLLDSLAETVLNYLKKEFFGGGEAVGEASLSAWLDNSGAAREYDITAAARDLNTNIVALNRLCRTRLGASFAKCAFRHKMQTALAKLKGGASVAETARAAGYADAFAFSKAFKRHFGKSPKNYLKM